MYVTFKLSIVCTKALWCKVNPTAQLLLFYLNLGFEFEVFHKIVLVFAQFWRKNAYFCEMHIFVKNAYFVKIYIFDIFTVEPINAQTKCHPFNVYQNVKNYTFLF